MFLFSIQKVLTFGAFLFDLKSVYSWQMIESNLKAIHWPQLEGKDTYFQGAKHKKPLAPHASLQQQKVQLYLNTKHLKILFCYIFIYFYLYVFCVFLCDHIAPSFARQTMMPIAHNCIWPFIHSLFISQATTHRIFQTRIMAKVKFLLWQFVSNVKFRPSGNVKDDQ